MSGCGVTNEDNPNDLMRSFKPNIKNFAVPGENSNYSLPSPNTGFAPKNECPIDYPDFKKDLLVPEGSEEIQVYNQPTPDTDSVDYQHKKTEQCFPLKYAVKQKTLFDY